MALVFTNMATPTHDSRMLHSMAKGLKMVAGEMAGIETDADGKFNADVATLKAQHGLKNIDTLQGYGRDTVTGQMLFIAKDGADFILVNQTSDLVVESTITDKVFFIAFGT